jgi:AraC family transcriptional regulator of arabinose operon
MINYGMMLLKYEFKECPDLFVKYGFLKSSPIYLSLLKNKSESFKEILHFHPGIEIIFIHEGKGKFLVEQQIFELTPGKLIFFKPYQLHHIQMEISDSQPYIRSLFIFEPNFLLEYLKPFPTLYNFLNYLWKDPFSVQVLYELNQDKFESFLRDYLDRFENNPIRDPKEEKTLFLISVLHFLQPLWEKHNEIKQQSLPFSPDIMRIINWIEENYQEEFQLEKLSQAVHISPNHVSFVFREATGNTITEYLTARRLKRASWLLKTTKLTVQEIGVQVGWSNSPYFCQVFKKKIGMTPNQFRFQ